MKSLEDMLELKASFPESAAYVYKINALFPEEVREKIKASVRAQQHPDLDYIGTVIQYEQNGVFQIYTGNLFIKFTDGVSDRFITSFLEKCRLTPKKKLHFASNCHFVDTCYALNSDIFDLSLELLSLPEVEYCHPELVVNRRSYSDSDNNETYRKYTGRKNEWVFEKTKVFEAWKYTKGKGTTICIIDDGLDFRMSPFSKEGKIIAPKDMHDVGGTRLPRHQFSEKHGTAVASIAVSDDPNAFGIAPEACLMPIRATSLGSVLQSEAFYWAAKNGADIISCSWGPPDGDLFDNNLKNRVYPIPPHTDMAIRYAANKGRNGKGCLIVFAAGNGKERLENDLYAAHPDVIAVGSTNINDELAIYSDFGAPLHCCFPSGDYIVGTDNMLTKRPEGITVIDALKNEGYSDDDYYEYFDGTSASCPGVAGIAALVLSVNPALTRPEVKEILKNSCKTIGPLSGYRDGYSDDFGYGLIQADLAVANAAKSVINPLTLNTMKAASLHIGINTVDQKFYGGKVPDLNGCVPDMIELSKLFAELGYKTHTLRNSEATIQKIRDTILELGNALSPSGILVITYAGHGAPLQNKDNDDEATGKDQAWVTYDGFLLDDELNIIFSNLQANIRVLLLSDSCYSGSMLRALDLDSEFNTNRSITFEDVEEILALHNLSVKDLNVRGRSIVRPEPKASVKLISACTDDQPALESPAGGLFTLTLVNTFRQLQGVNINYLAFKDRILEKIGRRQQPQLENSGTPNPVFDAQFPFQIEPAGPVTLPGPAVNSTPLPSGNSMAQNVYHTGKFLSGNQVYSPGAAGRSIVSKPWDLAYQQALGNTETGFIEPDLVSNLYIQDDPSPTRGADDGYLDTYPRPGDDYPLNPFIWHLDDRHSGLKKANEEVFPGIRLGKRNYDGPDYLVKIGHIDTGIINNHPSLPVNLLDGKTFRLLGSDSDAFDKDVKIAIGEQQGHGNATASLLAGRWIDFETTDNAFQGFFGAIPYARILPVKISESVALLSGENFAKAVRYCIEQGCDVITMSMAGLPSKVMASVVNDAYEAGVVLVSAGSNSFSQGAGRLLPDKILYPARYDRVIAAVGVTFTQRPYLNRFNTPETRAAGGRYMQSCYGPESALPTCVAAYTPNVPFFNKIEKDSSNRYSYFVRSGGGTSSATPQIAAAAALYIQKYNTELENIAGSQRWKKAEIVRTAIFESADKNRGYKEYYGQGTLRAYEAVSDPAYAPQKIAKLLSGPARKAPERRNWFLGGIFNAYLGRSIAANNSRDLDKDIQEMLITEINQLVYLDEKLSEYRNIDFESEEEFDLGSNPDFVLQLVNSEQASEFLKTTLTSTYNLNKSTIPGFRNQGSLPGFDSYQLKGDIANVLITSTNQEFNIIKTTSYKDGFGDKGYFIDEIELEIPLSSGRGFGLPDISIDLQSHGDLQIHSAILLEEYFDDDIIVRWQFNDPAKSRSVSAGSHTNHYELKTLASGSAAHGGGLRGGGLFKKIVVKVVKWVAPKVADALIKPKDIEKLAEPLGDGKYEILIYDLNQKAFSTQSGWTDIRLIDQGTRDKIFEDIRKSNKAVLLCFHGLFGSIEKGFDELLTVPESRTMLSERHCNYVIVFNHPSIFHGIQKNAAEIASLVRDWKLDQKSCTVIAKSRGGLVARYLFEHQWSNDKSPFVLQKLIMCGTPNQGTKMASKENWESLFNFTTNVARFTFGLTAPVIPMILSAIKAISMGVVQLPGINDQEEESEVLRELNAKSQSAGKYFVFTSNYEPKRKLFKKLLDELIVDRAIFKGEYNDSVVPLQSAIFRKNEISNKVNLSPDQYYICDPGEQVSHFGYLDPKYGKTTEKLFLVLKG